MGRVWFLGPRHGPPLGAYEGRVKAELDPGSDGAPSGKFSVPFSAASFGDMCFGWRARVARGGAVPGARPAAKAPGGKGGFVLCAGGGNRGSRSELWEKNIQQK